MKYSDFEHLNLILEKEGSNIDKLVDTVKSGKVFEADENNQLSTQSGNILTRAGRARMKLNDNAKKIQTQIMDDLYNKYYSQVLNNESKIIQQSIKLKENGSTVEEIKSSLQNNINAAFKAQAAQLNVLDKAADKILLNYTKKIDNLIQQSKMTDNNKLKLSNYWVMLTSQLKLNLYKYVQKKELNFIKKSLGTSDAEFSTEMESILENPLFDTKVTAAANEVANKKEEVKKDIATESEEDTQKTQDTSEKPEGESEEMKPAEEAPAEETPTEEAPAEETPAEEAPAEEVEGSEGYVDKNAQPIKVGETYTYLDKDGNTHSVTVKDISDSEMKFTKDGGDKVYTVSKELANKQKLTLGEATDKGRKKPIKLSGQEDTSSQVARPMTQTTVSTDKKRGIEQAKAQRKAARSNKKVQTKK